jgi:hypothetical protein
MRQLYGRLEMTVAIVLFLICSLSGITHGRIAVNSETSLLNCSHKRTPLQKATADLVEDFEKVFGKCPNIANDLSQAGGSFNWIALERDVPNQVERPIGWEL